MAKYTFNEHTKAIIENSVVPIGIYQMVDGRATVLIVSNGFCMLFGYRDQYEAVEKMTVDTHWNIHPDDVEKAEEVEYGFVKDNKPYNLVCRVKTVNGYRLIHARGKHVYTETGERIAVVWYIDEGALYDAERSKDEEKIEKLKSSMTSLLNNMPALSFSKSVENGMYVACNQMFADYAHKKTPAGVVGLTDHDIFDKETADHVFDAAGIQRQFQTTKLKFIDEIGRNCLLGMSVDVTEMGKAIVAAEEANRAKSVFLSNMSHEIRTPINAILGMNEMILRESSDPDIINYAKNIQSSGRTLLGLVNDLLDFSRIESGKMELISEEYEVSSLFGDIIRMISVRAEEKGLEYIIDIDEKIPRKLYGDSVRIEQCALNILTNAIKYTHRGTVTMKVRYNKTGYNNINMIIEIQDTGIGIKKEDMDKLMSPFERIEENRNRTIEGTGLGLSIVKNLLYMMGSKLEVESTYGEGSTFSFSVEQIVTDWHPLGDFSEAYNKSQINTNEYRESFQAPEACILVVDDVKMNLNVVTGLLKKVRINIDTADSGYKALEMYKASKYDCIFIDQRMPGMDGVETLHKMKEAKEDINRDTPCIALTANAISGVRDMFLKEGFDDYLSKPIEGSELEQMLIKYLPNEKVILPGDEGYITDTDVFNKKGIGNSDKRSEGKRNSFMDNFSNTEQIDAEQALQFCMNEELLLSTVSDFVDAAEDMPDLIEQYVSEGDTENYTIKVHALKSSSRMIGARELSELAAELEACGDAKDTAAIEAKTPALLEMYRKLRSDLKEVLGREKSAEQSVTGDNKTEDSREEISHDMLYDVYTGIRELAEAFDFDSAEDMLNSLDDYKLPDDEAERFEKVKKLVKGLERDKLLELL